MTPHKAKPILDSSRMIDHDFPFQIVKPASECSGAKLDVIQEFCRDLSLSPRGHTVRREDRWHQVFCFSVEADAVKFRERFGGIVFDPKWRGRGVNWMIWKG